MADRTVTARFIADVSGAVANIGKLTKSVKDSANAGIDFAKKNKTSFDEVGRGALAVGATAAVGLGMAVKKFAEFDKAMSGVKAATQESAGNMDLLRVAALQAGKDTAFSATEAAQGIEALAKAGVSTKDVLGGGLKGALDLAAAGQIDVATAAETAATAMTQFGLSGAQVPHIADLLAAGAGKAQGEVTDMAGALKQSGLVAAQFGLSVEETTGTLAAFASAGLIGSDAGTSFKTMLLQLANPSKQSAAAMKELGINAYDAQGAFIGIAPLADQLKTKMSGLSEEQRNAALATIFGTDAIRAANVLYTQGAKGISDWTTKVNDAGFAAQQARDKTNNLSGDVERLGGSFDTALIGSGSGANTVLRAIVQSADGAVTAFANLPPAVTGTATALTAVVAIGGLSAAGMLKAATAAGALKEAWTGLGKVGRGLTLAAGAIGVALVAAGLVYSAFAKQNADAKQRVSDLKSTLDATTGAITGNTRAFVANQLATSGMLEKAKGFGLNLSLLTDAALGSKPALDNLLGSLDGIIAAGTTQATAGKGGVATQWTADATAAKALRVEIIKNSTSLTQAQKELLLAAEGAKTNASATDLAAAAHAKAAAAADNEKQSLDDLIATMLKMPGQVLSLRDAQRAAESAFDDATASIKTNGRTLDINTPKGRANADALDAIAKAGNTLTETLTRNGASQVAIQKNLDTTKSRLITVGQSMGLTKAQAVAYANSVLAVPAAKKTNVTNTAPTAKKNLTPYLTSLGLIPTAKKTSVSVPGASGGKAQVDGLNRSLQNLPASKTVSVYTRMIQTNINPSVGVKVTKADGGTIPGYSPSPKADNIPIMATAGEFMQPVSAVDYYGPSFMEAVRTRSFPKPAGYTNGGRIGFATGGQVGGIDLGFLFSQMFAAPGNPLAGINASALLKAAQVAAQAQRSARAALTQQQRERNAATAAQARADAAVKAGSARVATLRASGASDKAIKAAQLDQIKLTNQLNAAKAKTKKENADVSASEKAYTKTVDASKAAADRYKAAQEQVNQVRQEAVALAKQIATQQLQGSSISDLTANNASAATLLASKQKQGKNLGAFATTLEKLQKQGLSVELLNQLRDGGLSNADIAANILASGKGYINQLNKAEGTLQGQAGRIGAGAAAQQFSVAYLTTNIQIGNEVTRVVQQLIKANNAATVRAANQKTGGR
jgi:TP901 family phage tail tape measure protein